MSSSTIIVVTLLFLVVVLCTGGYGGIILLSKSISNSIDGTFDTATANDATMIDGTGHGTFVRSDLVSTGIDAVVVYESGMTAAAGVSKSST